MPKFRPGKLLAESYSVGVALVFWGRFLGPVNTNRISIDDTHFFTGQGALSVVYLPYTDVPMSREAGCRKRLLYMSESATQSWEKWVRPEGSMLGSQKEFVSSTINLLSLDTLLPKGNPLPDSCHQPRNIVGVPQA